MLTRPTPQLLSLLPFVAVFAAGCGFVGLNHHSAEQVVTKSFQTAATPKIAVETFNGSVEVVTATQGTVKAKVTKRARGNTQEEAEANLQTIQVDMTQDGNTIHVTARPAEERMWSNRGASVELEVPDGSILDLHSSNGKISSIGLTGNVVAKTSNGGIDVKGNTGTLDLHTSNGGVEVEGGKGNLDLQTSNGTIHLKTAGGVVSAHTSNGGIRAEGKLGAGTNSFETTNGAIELKLPSHSQFRLEADTSNGKIQSDFAVSKEGSYTRTHMHGVVGENTDTAIRLQTSNGSIHIQRDAR
jgi:DUF4097 and DUF4098 domain-containing protein YvlB